MAVEKAAGEPMAEGNRRVVSMSERTASPPRLCDKLRGSGDYLLPL